MQLMECSGKYLCYYLILKIIIYCGSTITFFLEWFRIAVNWVAKNKDKGNSILKPLPTLLVSIVYVGQKPNLTTIYGRLKVRLTSAVDYKELTMGG